MDVPLQLQELLPNGYSYRVKKWTTFEKEPTHFESVILTNIYTEEEAQEWWHEFNIKSNTTMRVRATCPKTGKVNIFKIYLRCLHQGRAEKTEKQDNSQKSKSVVSLKRNTNCPAGMIVAIRRVIKYSRSKKRDPVDPVHPCEIQIRFVHNHPIKTADSLRFRPVSKEAEEKILSLYQAGHSPSSALEVLKIDLQIEHCSLFSEVISDRYHCPDKSFCYRLYYKHFGKDYASSAKKDIRSLLTSKVSHYNNVLGETCLSVGVSGVEYVIAACTPLMKRSHFLIQSGDIVYVELYECPANKDSVDVSRNLDERDRSERNEFDAIKDTHESSELNSRMTKALENFDKFCQRVKDGLKNQTEEFLPALEIMMKNIERKGNTAEQIISGLSFFGIVSAPSLVSKGKKRPASTYPTEEIVPKVHGRQMITYEKKKSANQVKSIPQPQSYSTTVANLPVTKLTDSSDNDK